LFDQAAQRLELIGEAELEIAESRGRANLPPGLVLSQQQWGGYRLLSAEGGKSPQILLDSALMARLPLPLKVDFDELQKCDFPKLRVAGWQIADTAGQGIGSPSLVKLQQQRLQILSLSVR
jgi:hypothetical protein